MLDAHVSFGLGSSNCPFELSTAAWAACMRVLYLLRR